MALQPPNALAEALARRAALETAVAKLPPGGRLPRQLYKNVVEFLAVQGESAILADWLRGSLMAGATVGQPDDQPPQVSVIVPCHNYGRYLRECVESVLCQTFTAWECIIINDGSSDDTAAVAAGLLADYPGHRLRYLEQECRGIVQPRNRGVTRAKGEFILPLDADDLIAPTFLERTVAVLRAKPELGYVSTKALFFGSVNKIWPREPLQPLALFAANQQTNTTLYRKAMWRDVGGYDERMIHGYMDWEFWIRCTKMGWMGEQLEDPLFFYRRKDDSVVMRAKKNDVAIKEQIVRLHPDIYDPARLPEAAEAMGQTNWIAPMLLRDPLRIRQRPGTRAAFAAPDPLETLKGQVLQALAHMLPANRAAFAGKSAGSGDPAAYAGLAARLGPKIRQRLAAGETAAAVEMAAALLAAYPLDKRAVMEMLAALAGSGEIAGAYGLGKLYLAVFAEAADLLAVLAGLLGQMAQGLDDAEALGLLEGAALFAPADPGVAAALAAVKTRLGLPEAPDGAGAGIVWYVSDCFGYGEGGVNGVTQAKSMTLSSLLRGRDGPEVCLVTGLRPGLPEALAEFSRFLAGVSGPDGYRWPRVVATIEAGGDIPEGLDPIGLLAGKLRPVVPVGPAPDCLVVEGVRLEAQDYLAGLGLQATPRRVFVHHTSPDQFRDAYTDVDMLPRAIEALAGYDCCVAVSANVLELWRQLPGLGGKRWVHIPNCAREEAAAALVARDRLELRDALGLPRQAFIALCLASVQVRKGQDILLAQLPTVLAGLPGSLVLFVGPVLEQWGGREITEYARRHFGQDAVRFLGARRNALDYVRAADCLVLPSREEALPLTILEAMALARPVVASDVNGIPELVVPGQTGLLFSHGAPEHLAEHLLHLGRDPELARTLGEAGRARYLEHFSRQQHAAKWRQLVAQLLSPGDRLGG